MANITLSQYCNYVKIKFSPVVKTIVGRYKKTKSKDAAKAFLVTMAFETKIMPIYFNWFCVKMSWPHNLMFENKIVRNNKYYENNQKQHNVVCYFETYGWNFLIGQAINWNVRTLFLSRKKVHSDVFLSM